MCGIVGCYSYKNGPVTGTVLQKMIAMLAHRGPDEYGMYKNGKVGMAQARLSIIDLFGGSQPIHNEDKSLWVVFNGEIFNYIELIEELKAKGHLFYTKTDTEVLLHLYEEEGINFVNRLNGQFAFAIYDVKKAEMILARDHVGIIPLFYTEVRNEVFLFASEMKALMRHPEVKREIDVNGLFQIYTLWSNLPGQTPFKNIFEVEPGQILRITARGIKKHRYWELQFPAAGESKWKSLDEYKEQLRHLMHNAVSLRLRADVPVASYLSGGIDSSIVASMVKKYHQNSLMTFSVAFADRDYDESAYQETMVNYLGTEHYTATATNSTIASKLAEVIYYAERPSIRTAPAPLFLLSQLVREHNIKVVLTGEGADEAFAGYNIFKEAKIRNFMAVNPDSTIREQLLFHLYPYVKGSSRAGKFWLAFFKKGLERYNDAAFSHYLRWSNSASIVSFMKKEHRENFKFDKFIDEVTTFLPGDMDRWHPLSRAQYLENRLFLPGYLLSTQGDRMLMAHSVEGRFPYLDKNVMEFAADLPPVFKMNGLNEKYILKETFKDILPEEVVYRKKQPYRAPVAGSLLDENAPDIIKLMLSEEMLNRFNYFEPGKVKLLQKKAENSRLSEKEEMALMAITSTQLLHYHFIEDFVNKKEIIPESIRLYE